MSRDEAGDYYGSSATFRSDIRLGLVAVDPRRDTSVCIQAGVQHDLKDINLKSRVHQRRARISAKYGDTSLGQSRPVLIFGVGEFPEGNRIVWSG